MKQESEKLRPRGKHLLNSISGTKAIPASLHIQTFGWLCENQFNTQIILWVIVILWLIDENCHWLIHEIMRLKWRWQTTYFVNVHLKISDYLTNLERTKRPMKRICPVKTTHAEQNAKFVGPCKIQTICQNKFTFSNAKYQFSKI